MTVKLSLSPSNASNIAAPTSEAVSSESQDNSGANNARKRPKSVSQWTVADVQKWLRKNCGDVFHLYSIKFLEQDITGRFFWRAHIFFVLNEVKLTSEGFSFKEIYLFHYACSDPKS